ncbi:MAG TPA: polysaccharide deacetylase family protein [Dehalococcoidia bacterium]|nr:polysaccharide deacetylase family protein [Dehalococcoidia bacterium]
MTRQALFPVLALACAAVALFAMALGGAGSSASQTFTPIPATRTPTPSPTPSVTATPSPTSTPTATATPYPLPPPLPPAPGRPHWPPSLLVTPLGHGDRAASAVYLTFDDGWGYPDEILSILQGRRAPATACLAGLFIDFDPAFVRRWVGAGYSLCNHTYSHTQLVPAGPTPSAGVLATRVRRELIEAQAALERAAPGADFVPFFRPAYGEEDETVRYTAAALGYRTILWSVDPQDWRPKLDAAQVCRSVVDGARGGDIVDLHFERRSTVEALPCIIDGLRARGFQLRGLESLPSDR